MVIADVLWFSAALPLALPVYVVWLWSCVGEFPTILGATYFGLAALDVLVCIIARVPMRLLPYAPLYTLMQTIIMLPIRLVAILVSSS